MSEKLRFEIGAKDNASSVLSGVQGKIIALDTIKNLTALLGGGVIYIGLASVDENLLAQLAALPAVKNMKFFEVSKQISLTGHLVAANHFVISSKKWAAMSADQQRRVQAAANKVEEDITNMALKDEAELVAFFKKEGLDVYTPDVPAFRRHVLDQYAKSKYAAGWVPGMMDRINKL